MDFQLPEELRMFKENLRRFVNTELIPVASSNGRPAITLHIGHPLLDLP